MSTAYEIGGHDVKLSISGMDELAQDLNRLMNKYPDRAGELLQKNAKELRKDYNKEVKNVSTKKKHNGKSLTKANTVKIYPIQGYGSKQYVEIGGKCPHFHLFEHGHQLEYPLWVGRPNRLTGRRKYVLKKGNPVQGKPVMKETIDRYESILPEVAKRLFDDLLKEEHLL